MSGRDQPKVSVDVKAEGGSSANVPVLNNNNISGSVNINCISYTAEQQSSSETPKKPRYNEDVLKLKEFLKSHKTEMKEKSEHIFEGKKENEAHLKEVYTELFITEGDIKKVNREHENIKIAEAFKNKKSQERPINCNEIFNLLKKKNKIVLTKGIAGIGKTVSVQKFILDWAEGKTNQDVDAVFLFPFRDINLIKDEQISFNEFLQKFYPDVRELENALLTKNYKVVLIFDGLDESHLPLSNESTILSSVEEKSSVDELFINLVRGHLLPSSLIWVTSRPAAAKQIHPEYVGLFTEVRGFTDQQKEEYFRKRFKDETQAFKIISYIKKSRSLYIMCHIPVFCWITATVLEDFLKNNEENIDTTLTEMYIHFLLIQMNIKNQKYDKGRVRERTKLLDSNKEMILKLAKLAFKQLKKENIVFYEKDLQDCDIDVSEDSEYTGMIAEIFKKENGLHEKKVFSFVHLTVQEFLAALHVFFCYLNKNIEELSFFLEGPQFKSNIYLHDILIEAIQKALESERGHLDLFVRFLLGISLESSQKLLIGLFTHTEDTTDSITKTTEFIKQLKDKDSISDEASINLFYCLLEVKDQSLYEDIQSYLHSDAHSETYLSYSMCLLMVYVLLMSENVLDEFNMKRYKTSEENYKIFVPAVRCCRKALFDSCNLTVEFCEIMALCLQSSNSHVKDLDVSNNDLQDSGVKLIADALKSPNCKLEILRLSMCNLTAECCESLSLSLQSSWCLLRDLDVSNNDLQDSGVKLIADALKSPDCKLEILRLSGCMVTDEGCCYLASALGSNPSSHLRELDLSYNHPEDSGRQMLSQKLNNHTLNLDHGGQLRITAGLRKYACDLTLDPNTANAHLVLSEDKKTVRYVNHSQPYPDHPDRFDCNMQVLCKESLTGRCYWEVEWSGSVVYISVSYKDISRKGWSARSFFGANEKSWSLQCCFGDIKVYHKNEERSFFCFYLFNRLGVYLDWSAGTLTFFSVSETQILKHLHTINTTFTQPLYAGIMIFDLSPNSSVSLC